MKKMPSLFVREWKGDRTITEAVTPGAEWVMAGEGVATRKWNGTSCLVQDGKLFKRYDAKGKRAVNLEEKGFVPAQPEPDPVSGHWPGWVPVDFDSPADCWHRKAWETAQSYAAVPDGPTNSSAPACKAVSRVPRYTSSSLTASICFLTHRAILRDYVHI